MATTKTNGSERSGNRLNLQQQRIYWDVLRSLEKEFHEKRPGYLDAVRQINEALAGVFASTIAQLETAFKVQAIKKWTPLAASTERRHTTAKFLTEVLSVKKKTEELESCLNLLRASVTDVNNQLKQLQQELGVQRVQTQAHADNGAAASAPS